MSRKSSHLQTLRSGERGQAMVEYSILNWLLVVALVLGLTVRIIPGSNPADLRKSVLELFLSGYVTYFNSFFFVLSLPFP